jgi:hypothetical protein
MAEHIDPAALFTLADAGWSVRADDGRLVFVNGASTIDVPVEGLMRWARDGEEISFDEALDAVPAELHGWISMAALIALRHCLGAHVLAAALPAGYADWRRLAERAGPVVGWMDALARLDGVEVPPIPEGIADGLADPPEDGASARPPG